MKKAKILIDRYSLIRDYVKNKNVLDLGCVDHFAETEKKKPFWLHKFIKKYAKSITGVDLDEKETIKLNKLGYNIIVDNVETYNLNKTFEVIVAGELIEHVRNVGLFLDATKKHMDSNSYFIITTPNTSAFRYFARCLFVGKNFDNNYNHTAWFDYETLKQSFDYADLKVYDWYYFYDSTKPWYKHFIEKIFVTLRPVFASNILFVLKKK